MAEEIRGTPVTPERSVEGEKEAEEVEEKERTALQRELLLALLDSPHSLEMLAARVTAPDGEHQIRHILQSLVDQGLVSRKEFTEGGESESLYWFCPDVEGGIASEEAMTETREELAKLRGRLRAVGRELLGVLSEPPNAELGPWLEEREAELESLQEQIALVTDIEKGRDEWKRRKATCMKFVDRVADDGFGGDWNRAVEFLRNKGVHIDMDEPPPPRDAQQTTSSLKKK